VTVMKRFVLLVALAGALVACRGGHSSAPAVGEVVTFHHPGSESRGHSSAPAAGPGGEGVVLEVVAKGLEMPVALAPFPDGRLFFAELGGTIRVIEGGQVQEEPVATLEVARPPGYSEYGLLGLALHPRFPEEPYLYAFYTVPDAQGHPLGQRVVRFRLEGNRAVETEVVVDGLPAGPNCCHNGGRLAFGPNGMLYVTLGDTERPYRAQNPSTPEGSVLRVAPDGSIPSDNPFSGSPVYAYGLRNVFGIAFHPRTGQLFATDNGPSGADGPPGYDELNIVVRGGNYGWPEVYGLAGDPRFIDPIYDSGPTPIVPTGLVIYGGDALPFQGDLFFCTWNLRALMRVPASQLEELRRGERKAVEPQDTGYPCALDVKEGYDGLLYFSDQEAIYRLRPQ